MKIDCANKTQLKNPINRRKTLVLAVFVCICSMLFAATETNAQIATRIIKIYPVNPQGSGSMYAPFRNGETIRFTAKIEFYHLSSREWMPLSGGRVNLVFHPRAVDLRFSPTPPFSKTADINGYVTWDVKVSDVRLNDRRGRSVSVLPSFEFKDPIYIYRGSRSPASFQLHNR